MMIAISDKNEADVAPQVVESLKRIFPSLIVANLPHRKFGNTTITAGDLNIVTDNGEIISIERKTVSDFLQSIPNRHIMNQIEVMHSHAKYVCLVITGKLMYSPTDMVIADRRETEWRGGDVRSLLRKIQLTPAIVEFCPEHEYANMVMEIYRTISGIDNLPKTYKNRIVTFPPTDERVQFLAQLPSVLLDRATSLLQFAGMMDGNADNEGYGTIASALHHLTIMSHYGKEVRPEHWGAKTVLTNRKFLGLKSNEYIGIIQENGEMEE